MLAIYGMVAVINAVSGISDPRDRIIAWQHPTSPDFAYLIVLLVGYPPFVMAWGPMLAASLPLVLGYVALTLRAGVPDPASWAIAGVAALAIGLVLLASRLHIIDELAAATETALSLATRDKLTGLLNRHGLEDRLPDLLAIAQRRGETTFATFVDIDGLKQANDLHGHEFGDRVIKAVANAIDREVRAGDLLARWGGDEFIILGVGDHEDPPVLRDRILRHLADSDIDPAKWGRTVSVGTASGSAHQHEFEELLRSADEDMYARRRALRSE